MSAPSAALSRPMPVRHRPGRMRRIIRSWPTMLLFVITLVFLAPFFWVLSNSLESTAEFRENNAKLWPAHPTLTSYHSVLFQDDFARSILNSLIVAAIVTVITLVLGALAGYALSRLPIRGGPVVLGFITLAGFFPLTAMIGPLFRLLSQLGLLDTFLGVSLSDLIYTLPLTTWLLASLFSQLPQEIEEAAMVDGCHRLEALWRVVLPLAAPAMATAAIFSFILAWSDFAFSLSFLQTPSNFTAPRMIIYLGQSKYMTNYNLIDAAVILTAIPIFLLVLFAQRRIVSGLTGGAVR